MKKLTVEINNDVFTPEIIWDFEYDKQVWYSIAISDEEFVRLASSLGMDVSNIKWSTHPSIIGVLRDGKWLYEITIEFKCVPFYPDKIIYG